LQDAVAALARPLGFEPETPVTIFALQKQGPVQVHVFRAPQNEVGSNCRQFEPMKNPG
jgi:hypothetical protein